MAFGKLAIVIGAGIIGSVLTKDGNLSDITYLVSGAFRIITKHLQQEKNNCPSASKPQTDLLAQVNSLRQELQQLRPSRPVTIVTGARSDSGRYGVTTVIVVGAVGLVIWWKGWKLSDMMFVTRRGFSDACTHVGKQLDHVSSSITAVKRHLSSRIDRVDSNLDECKEITAATKQEVSQLHGDLNLFHTDIESVHRAVQTLEKKLGRIEGSQNLATRGIYRLCQFVESLEQSMSTELTQNSSSMSKKAIDFPQSSAAVTRTGPLSALAEEAVVSSSAPEATVPSASIQSPRVLQTSTIVSASGLKELWEISNAIKGSMATNIVPANSSNVSNGTTEEPASGSSRSIWKLPSIRILSRTLSTAH